MKTRPAVLVLILSLVLPTAAPAQQPRFEGGVEMVTVDVRVVDGKGAPVMSLPREAFTVEEEGQPQAIETFEAIRGDAPAPAVPAVPPSVSTNVSAPAAGRAFVIVVDDVHISPTRMPAVQDAIGRFVSKTAHAGDRITLASTGTSLWWTGTLPGAAGDLAVFTGRLKGLRVADVAAAEISDWEAMTIRNGNQLVRTRVFNRLLDQGGLADIQASDASGAAALKDLNVDAGKSMIDMRAQGVYAQARSREQVTLRALQRIVGGIAAAGGRTVVLLVSQGFIFDPQISEMRDLKAAASRANATIHFVDASGLGGPPSADSAEAARALTDDSLSASLDAPLLEAQGAMSLAADTGGEVMRADLDTALSKVTDSSRAFYVIGYHSTNPKRDGKYRKLKVQVKGEGLHVRARKGYYAPGGKVDRPATPEAQVAEAIDAATDEASVPLQFTAYVREPVGENVTVLLAGAVDVVTAVPQGGTASLDYETLVTARDAAKQIRNHGHLDIRLDKGSRAALGPAGLPIVGHLELPPGAYQGRFVVRETTTGRVGRVVHDFYVPDPSNFRVSMPAIDTAPPGPQGPAWTARRTFPAVGRLFAFFQAFGQTAGGEVRTGFTFGPRGGQPIARMEPSPTGKDATGRPARLIAVPVDGLPPGDYELVITAKDMATGLTAESHDTIALR